MDELRNCRITVTPYYFSETVLKFKYASPINLHYKQII